MFYNIIRKLTLPVLAFLPLSASAFNWQQFVPDWTRFVPEEFSSSENTEVFYGPFAKNNYEAINLTVYGPVSLTNSKVENVLRVYGPVVLENTTNEGLVVLFGVMNAANSTLNDIHAATTDLKLTNTNANHIVILKNDICNPKTQHVYLTGTTKISGTITFEQGNGKVIVSDEGIISKDKIIGGKLKVKN